MPSSLTRVAVMMGGMSAEHEVSINSGRGVMQALDPDRFHGTAVVISKTGAWRYGDDPPRDIFAGVQQLRERGIDCVFIALHGPFGEDGRLQGMLDLLGMPYTGSGCAASALAMDKVRCKAVVQSQGVPVVGHVALGRPAWKVDPQSIIDAVQDVGFPCFVKPSCQGSSKGVKPVEDPRELGPAIDFAFQFGEYIMVESFVAGREITCSVLDVEPGRIRALPLTEIRPRTASFFDYDAKYLPGATEEITPAPLASDQAETIRELAVHAHEIVGCSGWSRSDFILGDDGPVFIEINTVPGLTQTSLYPQACAAAGISYSEMVTLFIDAAMREKAKKEPTA